MQSNNNKRKLSTQDYTQMVNKTVAVVVDDDDIISKKVNTFNKPSYYCLPHLSIEMHNQKITIPRVTVELILSYLFNEEDWKIEDYNPLEMERITKNAPLLSNYKRVCKAWKEWFDNSNIEKTINSRKTIKRKIKTLTSSLLEEYPITPKFLYMVYPPIFGKNIKDLSTLKKIAQSKHILGKSCESDYPRSYACLGLQKSFFEGQVKSVQGETKKFFCSPCGEGIVYNVRKGEIYSGKVIDNKAVGIGYGDIYDENMNELVYSGQLLDGIIHGRGTVCFTNGCYYKGEFKDGAPCESGILSCQGNVDYVPSVINWGVSDDLTDLKKKMISKRIEPLKNIKEYF